MHYFDPFGRLQPSDRDLSRAAAKRFALLAGLHERDEQRAGARLVRSTRPGLRRLVAKLS